MRRVGLCQIATWVALLSCCGSSKEQQVFSVEFSAQNDAQEPLAEVGFRIGGEDAGKTSTNGLLRVKVSAFEGESRKVKVQCPEGFIPPSEARDLQFRTFQQIGEKAASTGMTYSIVCRPEQRMAVLVIRAQGQNAPLPVVVDGRQVGLTDASGVYHLNLVRPAGTTVRAKIQTDQVPQLRPTSPEQMININDRDEFFFFDQKFTVDKPKVHKRRPTATAKPRPRPTKIQ